MHVLRDALKCEGLIRSQDEITGSERFGILTFSECVTITNPTFLEDLDFRGTCMQTACGNRSPLFCKMTC